MAVYKRNTNIDRARVDQLVYTCTDATELCLGTVQIDCKLVNRTVLYATLVSFKQNLLGMIATLIVVTPNEGMHFKVRVKIVRNASSGDLHRFHHRMHIEPTSM